MSMADPSWTELKEALVLEESVRDGRSTLVSTGELVFATAPLLDEAIERLFSDHPEELLLDLRRLHFMDSRGVRSLLKAMAACEAHGCTPLLTQSAPQIQRLFVLTGLTRKVQFIDPEPAILTSLESDNPPDRDLSHPHNSRGRAPR
jgi:anti-anti-sigma factor